LGPPVLGPPVIGVGPPKSEGGVVPPEPVPVPSFTPPLLGGMPTVPQGSPPPALLDRELLPEQLMTGSLSLGFVAVPVTGRVEPGPRLHGQVAPGAQRICAHLGSFGVVRIRSPSWLRHAIAPDGVPLGSVVRAMGSLPPPGGVGGPLVPAVHS
jgi:hypothetical protein